MAEQAPSALIMDNDSGSSYKKEEDKYRCLVLDSGPIIRLTEVTSLWNRAENFYTVPRVLDEIRDARARRHLETLPFELKVREPSREALQAIVDFARQTGDYQSLSAVDLQVLALLYDLEREGCGIAHIRTTPKRTMGLGKLESLGSQGESRKSMPDGYEDTAEDLESDNEQVEATEFFESHGEERSEELENTRSEPDKAPQQPSKPMSWASIAGTRPGRSDGPQTTPLDNMDSLETDLPTLGTDDNNKSPGEATSDSALSADFPSLAQTLRGERSDESVDGPNNMNNNPSTRTAQVRDNDDDAKDDDEEEERKWQSLQPVSKSGRLYNSFRNYGDLMKPAVVRKKKASTSVDTDEPISSEIDRMGPESGSADVGSDEPKSRIIGGMSLGGQDADVEDDGEGWIQDTAELHRIKATGGFAQGGMPAADGSLPQQAAGPPENQRAACATTDFAMQNVILQMNLVLLSVDGVKVRKLKSWVTRCGACFKVHTSRDNAGPLGSKRLFCEHCGSDMMQRIAASVDGKSGRLRLHLKKNYKHNLRGTKFSLPKPGSGNRFQGDLLLREDQLLTGAWNQKVKVRTGGKARAASQSMFGKDIATNVGCYENAASTDDIRAGFGRRNPNAAKGRERRGKKKKSSEKACGLRRY